MYHAGQLWALEEAELLPFALLAVSFRLLPQVK